MQKNCKPDEKIQQANPADVSKWRERDMPYEGCGIMYECPHYCPTHLFIAKSSTDKRAIKPLQSALTAALKLKFECFEAELANKQQEFLDDLKTAENNESQEKGTKSNLNSVKDAVSSAKGDSSICLKDNNENSKPANTDRNFPIHTANKSVNTQSQKKAKSQKQQEITSVPQFRAGLNDV